MHTREAERGLGPAAKQVAEHASTLARLEMELATLKTPQSLDALAKARLGLRPPQEGQIVGLP